uniref:Uncharacterized protein n=1 Tax=Solanum lycopersicum TaxID=4081 RepID=A0A3Q7FXH1_SOLLC
MAGDSGGARWWSGHKVIETSGSRGLGLLESIVFTVRGGGHGTDMYGKKEKMHHRLGVLRCLGVDGIFIVLKENLGRSPGPKAVIDERYMSSKRCMFQQKDDHRESRKQNSASITLHQHTTSYTATEHREVIGIQYLSML